MSHSPPVPPNRFFKWLAVMLLMVGSLSLLVNANPTLGGPLHCLVAQDSCESLENTLKQGEPGPLADAQPVYRFAAMGDWGAGTSFQKDVAAQMIRIHKTRPYRTVLMLGDNIYPDGNIKKHGEAYFTRMYQPLIQAGVHFVVALGNHDVLRGYEKDQVQFFRMPGRYYSVLPPAADIEFFVIDTNTFSKDRVQQQWLAKRLGESHALWKIVLGHHPIYSSGEHGSHPRLQAALEPLLEKHGAAFYLAGHDHDYERLKPVKGVQHLVSGGAGAYLRGFPRVAAGSLKREKRHHFLLFELQGDTMRMQAIDKQGEVFDTAQWTRKRQPQALPEAS